MTDISIIWAKVVLTLVKRSNSFNQRRVRLTVFDRLTVSSNTLSKTMLDQNVWSFSQT